MYSMGIGVGFYLFIYLFILVGEWGVLDLLQQNRGRNR
jgi:hypothetical protein